MDGLPSAHVSNSSSSDTNIWALHDTGATHHWLNPTSIFVTGSLKPVEDSNSRLKVAGGGVSLAVKGVGKVLLKAGDGTPFKLTEALYVPELSQNLISRGILKRKGVKEVFDDSDPTFFALVLSGLALFNGIFLENGLINIVLEPVSPSTSSITEMSDSLAHSSTLHRCLGHVSEAYLKSMIKHGSIDGVIDD